MYWIHALPFLVWVTVVLDAFRDSGINRPNSTSRFWWHACKHGEMYPLWLMPTVYWLVNWLGVTSSAFGALMAFAIICWGSWFVAYQINVWGDSY